MKITIKHPHIEEKHVKHTAGVSFVVGTILEVAHVLYPTGLVLLMIAGCVGVYEPYIVRHVKGDLSRLNDGESRD